MRFLLGFVCASLAMASLAAPGQASARSWTDAEVADLESAAEAASREGLPRPAGLERLAFLTHMSAFDEAYLAARDAAADDILAAMANAYARGLIDPRAADADWFIPRPPPPDPAALAHALDAGAAPSAVLQSLLPRSAEYAALRAALAGLQQDTHADSAQIDQLRVNLERWRWLPRDLPQARVEVRVPALDLNLYATGVIAETHKVIVGARNAPTPSFLAGIRAVTINPAWEPPQAIAARELLPRFRRNPGAAAQDGFEVINAAGESIPLSLVDWNERPFPYRLRQQPGPRNALGRIRFDLPNPYSIYLHDTPDHRLFAREDRALSHGCIRVENPETMAARLLAPLGWSEAAVQAAIDAGATQNVALAAETPVYVLYLTTSLASDGAVLYHRDIYGRDTAVVRALDTIRPSAPSLAQSQVPLSSECH